MTDEPTEEMASPELPSLERGPRQPDQQQWTGTGTPRSADTGRQAEGALGDRASDIDPAVAIGSTTSSHPAEADEAQVNRSGSGGSGGSSTEDDPRIEGSTSESMSELLSGESDES